MRHSELFRRKSKDLRQKSVRSEKDGKEKPEGKKEDEEEEDSDESTERDYDSQDSPENSEDDSEVNIFIYQYFLSYILFCIFFLNHILSFF